MPLCPIKWWHTKFFTKLHKRPLLISSVVKDAVSDLRQFLAIESSWKIMINTFLICTCYAFLLNQSSDIREVWKYWPLKDGFPSISQKCYRTTILWWVEQKLQTFLTVFREQPSKYCIVELTAVFVCLLLSWSRRYSMKKVATSAARNFNKSWPLYLNFSNMINLCPNIWFIKNSKCQ